jgi:crossover junction endodeoxyribonuclease RuvC
MVILGIDPGFRVTGFGILKKDGQKSFLVDYGFLSMPQADSLAKRVCTFHDFFTEKISTHGVTDIALETPFLGKNAQNFLKLGYLRGILYLLAEKHSLVLHEFAPTQVKQSLTGFGAASKEQVARVIVRLFPSIEVPKKADVTDALAITLCGLWQVRPVVTAVRQG